MLSCSRITARSAGNRVVERTVMQARTAVTSGRTLSEPLKGSTVFPPMVVHMINVGENTGALDQMPSKIADFYDDEVDTAVSALMSLLEPVMIVFLGVVVGGEGTERVGGPVGPVHDDVRHRARRPEPDVDRRIAARQVAVGGADSPGETALADR